MSRSRRVGTSLETCPECVTGIRRRPGDVCRDCEAARQRDRYRRGAGDRRKRKRRKARSS